MKKFFVSSVVIITFVFYSLYQKVYGIQEVPIFVPNNIVNTEDDIPSINLSPTSMPITNQPVQTKKIPNNIPIPTSASKPRYKDGKYIGDPADAFYGNIQVQAIISNGRITNIQFLQYPNDRSTSIYINSQADPMLAQEAIQAQSANVNIISGATDSSIAFIQSLQSILNKAKN